MRGRLAGAIGRRKPLSHHGDIIHRLRARRKILGAKGCAWFHRPESSPIVDRGGDSTVRMAKSPGLQIGSHLCRRPFAQPPLPLLPEAGGEELFVLLAEEPRLMRLEDEPL